MKKKYKITFEPNFGGLDCIVFEIQTELKQDAVDTAVSKMKELQGENWEQHYSQGRIKEIYVIDNYDKEEINMEEIRADFVLVEGDGEAIKDFYICKYPVTQKEIVGYNPSYFIRNPDNPVESITWYDAVMYCNKFSEREGLKPYYDISDIEAKNRNITFAKVAISGGTGYRLPTNEEWVYAAKGGKKSKGYKYSGSNDIDEVAWYNKNSYGKTNPVGQKKPNELGIYDMTGNVWEWTGTKTEDSCYRYNRGGSYFNLITTCEINSSNCYKEDFIENFLGFRICKSLNKK